ncbi:MAG: hypothetical protein IKA70_03585 [Alistipes sp.]|nr:hypothetical protein [Alistipes sp.]
MKKIIVSMMALAAFVACTSNFDEEVTVTPQNGTIVNQGGDYSVYAEVGVGDDETKATYDNLKAVWEAGDQIAVLQEHANYGSTFSVVNALGIYSGVGTSKAMFNGNISVNTTAPRVYHIAYPKSATSFTVNDTCTDNSDVTYSTRNTGWISKTYYSTATGSFTHTYSSNVKLTLPTTQNGKWEPYMFGTTGKAVAANAIGDMKLKTLTGAVAVRVYASDGKTPKRVTQITVAADTNIAGYFYGSSSSKGSTGSLTGTEKSSNNADNANTAAYNDLLAKAQGTQPSTTTLSQTLNLAFNGTATEITATGLETIAADENGDYIYYINVAPVSVGSLTITAVDELGSAVTRTFGARELKVATRHGYNISWDDASLTGGEASTWYDEYATSHEIKGAANTLYTAEAHISGVAASDVLSFGVEINGTLYGETSGTLTLPAQTIRLDESNTYKVCIYAKISSNGEQKELRTGIEYCNVVSIPTITDDYYIQSSYSKNGNEEKTNSISGNEIRAYAKLSDNYIASNLVEGGYQLVWSGKANGSATHALGSEYKLTGIAAGNWGQYDCYVKVTLTNGYVCSTDSHTTHVTGIPYHADWRSKDYSDWAYSNISDNGSNLQVSNSKLGCIISPAFYLPGGSVSAKAAIAASTNATSSGNYDRSYIYTGTRSSSASESGTYVKIGYVSDFSGLVSDTPLVTAETTYTLSTSTPCMVFTAKDFSIACNTYVMQAQIIYAL